MSSCRADNLQHTFNVNKRQPVLGITSQHEIRCNMCQVGQYIYSVFPQEMHAGLELLISPFFTPNLTKVDGGGGESNRRNRTEFFHSRSNTQNDGKEGKSRRTWKRTCEICWAGRSLWDLKTVRSWRWVESLTYHIPIELVSHPSFEKKTLFLSSCHPIVLHLTLLVAAMVPSSACLFCRSSEQILSWHNSHYRKTQ